LLQVTAHSSPGDQARAFFDELWQKGDHWQLETSAYEQAKYARQLELIGGRRYRNALEIGCGSGLFTRSLARVADRVVAVDVSAVAIKQAGANCAGIHVDFRGIDVMEYKPAADGPFDLIVLSETIYYLGWLYPFFNLAWMAFQLHEATSPLGRLLMTNTFGGLKSYLHRPWLIATYRDLFRNVGYTLKVEEVFTGEKNGVALEAMICLFERPAENPEPTRKCQGGAG
jgi:SAM-dependent methyltransferase